MVIESGMAEIDNLVGNDHLICGPLGRVAGTGKERNLERWGKCFGERDGWPASFGRGSMAARLPPVKPTYCSATTEMRNLGEVPTAAGCTVVRVGRGSGMSSA